MRDRVALAGGPRAVEHHGALPVEMSRRLVLVQGLEDRRQRLAAVKDVGRLGADSLAVRTLAGAGAPPTRQECTGCLRRSRCEVRVWLGFLGRSTAGSPARGGSGVS